MFEARLTAQFIRATRKIDTATLRQAIEELLSDPYHARGSHVLGNVWAGFRGANFSQIDRFVFRICEECVARHQEKLNPLACCAQIADNKQVVTFTDFGDYHESAGRRRLRPARSYEVVAPEKESESDTGSA